MGKENKKKEKGKKIINNESKKILPVLLSIVHEIGVSNGSFPFKFLISLFLHSLSRYVYIKSFFF